MNLSITCPACSSRIALPPDTSGKILRGRERKPLLPLIDLSVVQRPLGYEVPVIVNMDLDELYELAIQGKKVGMTVDEYIGCLATDTI